MSDQLKKGDKVEWKTSQGKTSGEVEKKLTSPTDIKVDTQQNDHLVMLNIRAGGTL